MAKGRDVSWLRGLEIGDPPALLQLADDVSTLALYLEDCVRDEGIQKDIASIADRWSALRIKRMEQRR